MSIIIDNPKMNKMDEMLRRWSHDDHQGRRTALYEVEDSRITPTEHPKVIELCAGDAPVGALLVERGWKPGDITCVDRFISPTPMIDGQWVYMDIVRLEDALKHNALLDPDVLKMKEQYDAAIFIQGHVGWERPWENAQKVCEFFTKPGGKIIAVG